MMTNTRLIFKRMDSHRKRSILQRLFSADPSWQSRVGNDAFRNKTVQVIAFRRRLRFRQPHQSLQHRTSVFRVREIIQSVPEGFTGPEYVRCCDRRKISAALCQQIAAQKSTGDLLGQKSTVQCMGYMGASIQRTRCVPREITSPSASVRGFNRQYPQLIPWPRSYRRAVWIEGLQQAIRQVSRIRQPLRGKSRCIGSVRPAVRWRPLHVRAETSFWVRCGITRVHRQQ